MAECSCDCGLEKETGDRMGAGLCAERKALLRA